MIVDHAAVAVVRVGLERTKLTGVCFGLTIRLFC